MPTVDAVTMAIYRSSVFFMFLAPCIQKREGEREREGRERERGYSSKLELLFYS